VWQLAVSLFAVTRGYLDDVEVEKVLSFESALLDHMKSQHAAWVERIESTKDMSADDEKALIGVIEAFKKTGAY
jgi:F-type H+-transporting ATPase subunit alpha